MFFPSISEKILYLVCWMGILQGILLSGLIYFHPKSDRSVNKFLALHILCLSLVATIPTIIQFISWQKSFFIQPLPLLVGPFLYFYLRSFKETITWRKAIPHLIPFVLFLFLAYWNISTLARKYPDLKDMSADTLRTPGTIAMVCIRLTQLIVYYFLSRNVIRSYQKSIRHLFSETSHINLQWAKVMINGYLFLVIAGVLLFPLIFRFPEYFNLILLILMTLAAPYIYIATFKGVSQPSLWQTKPGISREVLEREIMEAEQIEEEIEQAENAKVVKPGLNDQKLDGIVKGIVSLMEKEKLYQETDLTVQQLADKLNIPTYQVSQAINEGMKRNFYDLINNYRVEEAKQLLLHPKNRNYTILSVGFEAGFNSKTTFNTVFKKFTGLTPTEFRDKQLISPVEA